MLDAASYDVLWSIYDQTGIRPEYLLPVLARESGLDPSIPNSAGYPYYGINQASTDLISTYAGTDPSTYLTWPASRQLDTVVRGMLAALVNRYGPLRSATRVYQANFLPATLSTARSLNSVVAGENGPYATEYSANVGLDADHNGVITLSDLATEMARMVAKSYVQQAIADAYKVRPTEVMHNPVYGDDFTSGFQQAVSMAIGGIALGAGIYYVWEWAQARRLRFA